MSKRKDVTPNPEAEPKIQDSAVAVDTATSKGIPRRAFMMLSQCGKVRLGNFVDPKYTIGAAIPKKYL